MKKYDELTTVEKISYTHGYINGVCHDCTKRRSADDFNKLAGNEPYCDGCEKKNHIEFIKKSCWRCMLDMIFISAVFTVVIVIAIIIVKLLNR